MIQINWSDIKKDVQKQTWRIAKVTLQDEELQSDAQEDDSKGSVKFVLRFAEEGMAMVTQAMREVIQLSTTSVATDSLDDNKEKWTITLKDTLGIDEKSLAMLIHKFVVEYILFKWCHHWAINNSSTYETSYVKTLADIVNASFSLDWCVKDKRPAYPEESSEITISYE